MCILWRDERCDGSIFFCFVYPDESDGCLDLESIRSFLSSCPVEKMVEKIEMEEAHFPTA